MADELKPCPFCGGEARMFYVDGWARPRCKCGANSGVLAGSDSEAIAAWNRRPAPAASGGDERVRHKKRGTTYRVIGVGELQTETPLTEGVRVVAYRCEADGCLWLRPESEFRDGRFEPAPSMTDAAWLRRMADLEEGHDVSAGSGTVTAGVSDAELRCCGCGRETINRVKQCSCITNVGRGPSSPGTEWMRDPASAIVGKASEPTDPDQLRGFAAYCRSGVCIDKSDDDLLASKFDEAAARILALSTSAERLREERASFVCGAADHVE